MFTLGDFVIIKIMTGGAPGDLSHVLSTPAYRYPLLMGKIDWGGGDVHNGAPGYAPVHLHPDPLGQIEAHMRLRGWRRVGFYGVCVALLARTVFPVYYMIMLSLVAWEDLFKPRLYVVNPTFENYDQTLTQSNYFVSQFWTQMYNSVSIARLTTAAVLVVGTLGSFALARITFRGSRAIQSLTLFTYIIPSSFVSIPFFKLMADYDLIGTRLSVILAMITFASRMPSGYFGTTGRLFRPISMRRQ